MKLETGRVVRFTRGLGCRFAGTRYGMVRRLTGRYVTVQLASDPDAASLSARFRGHKLRLNRDEIDGIVFRKKLHEVVV